jgi:hypothetical protein
MATEPIYPDLPSSDSDQYTTATAPIFADTQAYNYNRHRNSQTKSPPPYMGQRNNNDDEEEKHMFDVDREQNSPTVDSNGVMLLLDENERLTVR